MWKAFSDFFWLSFMTKKHLNCVLVIKIYRETTKLYQIDGQLMDLTGLKCTIVEIHFVYYVPFSAYQLRAGVWGFPGKQRRKLGNWFQITCI